MHDRIRRRWAGGDRASRPMPESSPSPGPERTQEGPGGTRRSPGERGCSGRRRGGGHPIARLERKRPAPRAEAAAVRPAPPDPEVVAKPPRATEPGHIAGTRTTGPRSAVPRGSLAHSVSVERPSAADRRRILTRPAATLRWRCADGVPVLYSIAWMPDDLRSFEPCCPSVEGVDGRRSGPSCGGRNHRVGEVSSALARRGG